MGAGEPLSRPTIIPSWNISYSEIRLTFDKKVEVNFCNLSIMSDTLTVVVPVQALAERSQGAYLRYPEETLCFTPNGVGWAPSGAHFISRPYFLSGKLR